MKVKFVFILHFTLVTILFFSTGSYRNWPYKIESDGKYYYQYLISIWYDGDLDFTNNYTGPALPFMRTEIDHYQFKNIISPQTGRPTNLFTTGLAVLWAPFFILSYGLAYVLNSTGLTAIPLDGWGQYFQYTVMYTGVVYAGLTLYLIYQLLHRYFAENVALIAAFLLFWGTNWAYYTIFEVSLSHAYDLFTLVLFLWLHWRALDRPGNSAFGLSGLAAALHVLVRTQNVLTIAILVIYYFLTSDRSQNQTWERSIRPVIQKYLLFTVAFVAGLTPLLLSNWYLFGNIFIIPQGNDFLNLTDPAFYGVLLSGRNGLFSHHPVLWLGVAGLILALIKAKAEQPSLVRLGYPLLLVFVVQLYLNATVADWWGGHAFGQRRLLSSLLLFGLGFAYLQKYWYKIAPKSTALIGVVVALFILTNLYLTYIHLFLWGYDDPHDILKWMFHDGPILIYLQNFQ